MSKVKEMMLILRLMFLIKVGMWKLAQLKIRLIFTENLLESFSLILSKINHCAREGQSIIFIFQCKKKVISGLRAGINKKILAHLQTKESEVLKLHGIRIAHALDPIRGSLPDYWLKETSYVNTTFPHKSYGERHGMQFFKFRNLMTPFSNN